MLPVIMQDTQLRKELAAKLEDISLSANALQPVPDEFADGSDPAWAEEYANRQIPDLYRRASILLGSHGFTLEAQQLDQLYQRWSNELLWKIQDGPEEGDYASLHVLTDFLANMRYVVNPDIGARDLGRHPSQLNLLLHVLRHLEGALTVLKTYPDGELEFERIVESVLVCVFPKMLPNVTISRPLKAFKPDTGIPEAKTLIDYKFIREAAEVAKKVDEINADIIGFKKEGWNHFVFVVYEDQRHATLDQWEEHFRELQDVTIVLVKGSLNKPPAKP